MLQDPYERTQHEINVLVPKVHAAISRVFQPYFDRYTGKQIPEVKYVLTSAYNMAQTITYVGLPRMMRDWSYGKQSQHWLNQKNSHFFELVINTDPVICYHSINNRLPMHFLVTAHAIGGHAVFFQLNRLFEDTRPETVVQRFAQQEEKVDELISDPDFGIDRVERIVDAARAVQSHVPRVPEYKVLVKEGPDKGKLLPVIAIDEHKQREELNRKLRELKNQILVEGEASQTAAERLKKEAWEVEAALQRHPIAPVADLLGFVMDPGNSPHLTDQERMLIEFVRTQSLYFQPQGRTKRMNEGFASYMEKYLLEQPEVGLTYELHVDLSRYWTMHLQNPVSMYFDPYTCGLFIWNHIDEMAQKERKEQGLEDEEIEISSKALGRDDTGLLIETDEIVTEKVKVRNFDKLMDILHTHDDASFTREYLTHELIEEINVRAIKWCENTIERINEILKRTGWYAYAFAEFPLTLEEMMMQVQLWMQGAQQAQQASQYYGTPLFPINPAMFKTMATLLQIVMAYDNNRNETRNGIIRKGIAPSPPIILLTDTGRFGGDAVWTLQHQYTEAEGPLLQSEARETLLRYKRLSPCPVQLLTRDEEIDEWGNATGNIVPYRYYTDDGTTVLEGWF
jgi:stage V sporulation protein R